MSNDSTAFEDFTAKYPKRTMHPEQTLVFQNEIPRTAYLVNTGIVRVFSLNANGDECNVNFLHNHSILPVEYIFEKASASLFYYATVVKSEIVAVPIEEIRTELRSNIALRDFFFESFITKYVGAELHIQALEQTKAKEKIIHILQFLVMRFGRSLGQGRWEIELQLKQTDIANMIGVTRETVAAELGKLKRSNIISYKSFRYTVNMEELAKQIGIQDWEEIEII